jgi:hypothetical protein|tara:strand:+ start:2132 stop:2515 length:384 start_codon:yes stop_codon:yes gene_type:complete
MLGKVILWMSALLFIGYGLVSLFFPEVPAGLVDLKITNVDAAAEIRAIYGGLQIGIGLFCLLAAVNSDLYRAGLMLLVLGIGALALGRLYSILTTADSVTTYTNGALLFELTIAVLAAVALKIQNKN